jgi:DNA invertase Pin-like site-specific DNA recombinase
VQRLRAYERVSTARQGASGLGLEAQLQAIDGFAAQRKATLLARFTEVESGRNPDRPDWHARCTLPGSRARRW